MIKDTLENLIKAVTNTPYSENLLAARQEYNKYIGDIFDDDKSYENRMSLFLEWYIFDHIDPTSDKTVLELIIKNDKKIPSDILKSISSFVSNIHALFIVKKLKKKSVRVLNLFNNEQYDVVEPLEKFNFCKNCIFEGRLLSYKNSYYFTGMFCFHPDDSKIFIKHEIKKIITIEKSNMNIFNDKKDKLSAETKKLNKTIVDIKKIQLKLKSSKSEKKIFKLKVKLPKIESIKGFYEDSCSSLTKEITLFNKEKIIRERKSNQRLLMFKLSSMKLLFERSRNIQINNIYKN
jgi:hypothetical protein